MWFVGGWVRDKLLSKQSCDIDVAISGDTTTAAEFATYLKQQFLADQEHADKYKDEATRTGVENAEIKGFYQIDRNPGKGKHLETTSALIQSANANDENIRIDVMIPGLRDLEQLLPRVLTTHSALVHQLFFSGHSVALRTPIS